MADYFTRFSCILDVGSAENVGKALAIQDVMNMELDEEDGSRLGFQAERDAIHGPGLVWIQSIESGTPEDVATFVVRCAEALDLKGPWSFCWSLSASKPLLDAYGGGAVVIDLGKRKVVEWHDSSTWAEERKNKMLPRTA